VHFPHTYTSLKIYCVLYEHLLNSDRIIVYEIRSNQQPFLNVYMKIVHLLFEENKKYYQISYSDSRKKSSVSVLKHPKVKILLLFCLNSLHIVLYKQYSPGI